jgi:tripartite-type tricarboxylate transporter receptor subunit TctC
VPFQGTGLALQAVISNQVGAMWGFMAGLIPHIRGGSLRALAVGSTERSPALPDVPTVAEAGVPGYEAVSWIGMVAPAGTPGPVMDKLSNTIQAAMREKAVVDNLVSGGSEIVASKPEELRRVMESDDAKYGKLSDLFKTAN